MLLPSPSLPLQLPQFPNSNILFSAIHRSIKGLVGFKILEELLLDNNHLKDEIELPEMPTLRTLTINKNEISFIQNISYNGLLHLTLVIVMPNVLRKVRL